jgi:hypothetical protein
MLKPTAATEVDEDDKEETWVDPPGLTAFRWYGGPMQHKCIEAPPQALRWKEKPNEVLVVDIRHDPWNGKGRAPPWDAALGEPRWFFDTGPRNQPFKVYFAFNASMSTVHVTVNTAWFLTVHVDSEFKIWTVVAAPGEQKEYLRDDWAYKKVVADLCCFLRHDGSCRHNPSDYRPWP